jgi:hypothetical protein
MEDLLTIVTIPGVDSKQIVFGLERFGASLREEAASVREQSGVGPMLMVLPEAERKAASARQLPAVLPVWLGEKTLTLLVDKQTRDRLAHGAHE